MGLGTFLDVFCSEKNSYRKNQDGHMLKPLQLTLFLFQNAILFQHLNTRHKQTGKKHVSFSH